ncbi:ATP-dependent helicase HrpB [Pelagicoccus sp. SDUM812003]|uniref:ATP-dependent helicase HrpB n=1 Tax=Pelagicoccus sp. SDUM812003 TaxID=3041267 RepID=UPI00280C9A61|nr:ATP-dependent helicase HrpB [Pelagicoccus sp. SDUM812003]MDQ8201990.1 ATP-dependent helicase HrpB [Pelagicoccus sp. SDUM812003]
MSLPILEIEEAFRTKLANTNRLVLEAPTGSGKSTQTPQFLLKGGFLDDGIAIVLQPRRIAARMLAKRVAWELGSSLGETVGYQVRHERVFSKQTKILFVTEGVLLRRMISDPDLQGVSCIVFDEFHERSLHADLTLARSMMLQRTRRRDLKLIVMSATLDSQQLETYLAPCEIVKSEGRTYPVDTRYLDRRSSVSGRAIWDLAAEQVSCLVREQPEGHALVFMPGAFEIGKTIAALGSKLSSHEFELLPLHSELSPKDQDRAVEGGDRRKVIVATNVAETSLTIDDVRIVVDSGQARVARYDHVRGINTLWIEKISDASARQRAGRAGRTAPGIALRLWSEQEQADRAPFEEPEVRRVDLSEMLLSLLATGIESVDAFDWFEAPSEERLKDAVGLLNALGAIDESGRLTERGRVMSAFPLHPRYASMLIEAGRLGCVEEIALVAALAQSKSILLRKVDKPVAKRREALWDGASESDLIAQTKAWQAAFNARFDMRFCQEHGIHAQSSRQALQIANQLSQYAEACGLSESIEGKKTPQEVDEAVRRCVLYGFPDRVCKRLDRGTLRCAMVGGRRGNLARESVVGDATLLVACEVNEIGRQGGEVTTVFNQCTAIEREWLEDLFPRLFRDVSETVFDERQKRVVSRRSVRFQDLDIETVESPEVDSGAAAEALAALISEGKAQLGQWDDKVEHFIRKVNLIASVYPEYEIDPIDEDARALIVEQCCQGARSLRDLKKLDVLPTVRDWVGREVCSLVDKELPDRVRLANDRPAALRAEEDGRLTLSAKIQCLYDLPDTPKFCQGRVAPRIELLAPNMRPIQTTEDLQAFWKGSYEGIKKELKGRYPKHEWR